MALSSNPGPASVLTNNSTLTTAAAIPPGLTFAQLQLYTNVSGNPSYVLSNGSIAGWATGVGWVLAAGGTGVTNLTSSTLTVTNPTGPTADLEIPATGVTSGSYTSANITVNANGLITAAANGSGGGSSAFNALTSGTNTTATMTVGSGASLSASGTGTISATSVNGAAVPTNAGVVGTNSSGQIVSQTTTGSGNNVLATSPTLVTPALGTPSALVLTNATGLPNASVIGLAASATTDTTNAANIAAGTLPYARLPAINVSLITGLAPSATTDTTNAANISTGVLNSARIPQATLKNYSPSSYNNFRKALALRQASGTSFNVLCIGDSTTGGYTNTASNEVAGSWVRRLADQLTLAGIPSGWQNFMGDHNASGSDSRVTLGSGWASFNGTGTIGVGGAMFYNQTNTNAISFAPTIQTDTCDVYYFDATGGGGNMTILAGTAGTTAVTSGGTITNGATGKMLKQTAVTTLAQNIWTAQKTATNAQPVYIVGMVAYNSATPEVHVVNLGVNSATLNYYLDTSKIYSAYTELTGSGQALTGTPLAIINLGINDWVNNTGGPFPPTTTPATWGTNFATLVAGLQAVNTDVVVVIPVPSISTSASLTLQAQYVSQMYQVAANYGCAVLDITARWTSEAVSQPLGYYGDAMLHPSATVGYPDIAKLVSSFFLNA